MTYSRAAKAGYIVQDCCPLCGQRGDTLRHRIWFCPHPDAVAARDAVAPAWLQAEARRSPDTDTFWTNGFLPHPGDTWPGPTSAPQAMVQFGGDDDDERPAHHEGTHEAPRLCGRLSGDGSCTAHVFPELRRAAMAIVQRRADGSRGWTIQCTVPPPVPQTPPRPRSFACSPSRSASLTLLPMPASPPTVPMSWRHKMAPPPMLSGLAELTQGS
jgi:hypothetical protein